MEKTNQTLLIQSNLSTSMKKNQNCRSASGSMYLYMCMHVCVHICMYIMFAVSVYLLVLNGMEWNGKPYPVLQFNQGAKEE